MSDCPNVLPVGEIAAGQTSVGSAPEEANPGESCGQDSSEGETVRLAASNVSGHPDPREAAGQKEMPDFNVKGEGERERGREDPPGPD